jgi:hypothetical protein
MTEPKIGAKLLDILVTVALVGTLAACYLLLDAPRDEFMMGELAIIILFVAIVGRVLDKDGKKEGMATVASKARGYWNKGNRDLRKGTDDVLSTVGKPFRELNKKIGF